MSEDYQQQQQLPHQTLKPHLLTTDDRVVLLEEKLGYTYQFRHDALVLEALTLPSRRGKTDNRNLAILGDKLLDFHLSTQWRKTHCSRKVYDDARQALTSNSALAIAGWARDIGACVVGWSDEAMDVEMRAMATTVEAVVAAVYLDAEKRQKGVGMCAVNRVATGLGISFWKYLEHSM